jgi:hypothetical protein
LNLERHLQVLWRYRWITVGGIVLGVFLALTAAFRLPSFEPRGQEVWSTESNVLVTQEGFPWGRVTLPVTEGIGGVQPTDGATPTEEELRQSKRLNFADPTRFSDLAMLYSVISLSDRVRLNLPGRPAADQVKAQPYDLTGRGDAFLPIILFTTTAATPENALKLNEATVAGLGEVLVTEQDNAEVPPKQRIKLQTLKRPSEPVLVEGRSYVSSILALVLCLVGTLALTHLLEGLAMRRQPLPYDWLLPDEDFVSADGDLVTPAGEPIGDERTGSEPNGNGAPTNPAARRGKR